VLSLAAAAVILRASGGALDGLGTESIVYASGAQRVSAPRRLVLGLWGTGALYFAVWLVVAAVAYLVSRRYDGEGPFRRILAFVGWTLAPTLVPAVATSLLMAMFFLDAPAFESEAALRTWVQSNVAGNPLRVAVEAVRPLFTLWMVYLWVLAAEYGRNLTRRQALVAVALPGAVAALNALGSLAAVVGRALGLV
jgi:hypothetical protein